MASNKKPAENLKFDNSLPAYVPIDPTRDVQVNKPQDAMGAGDTGYNDRYDREQEALGRANLNRISSFLNSPAAALEKDKLQMDNYRYPSDLGTNFEHILRIFIFQQEKSNFNYSIIPGDQFRFDSQAGLNKILQIDVGEEAAGIATLNASDDIAGIFSSKVKGVVNNTKKGAKAVGSVGGAFATGENGFDLRRKTRKSCAYISLYMPDTLSVIDNHDYDRVSMTEALGTAGLLGNTLQNKNNTAATSEAAAALAKSSGALGDKATDAALFSAGYALNPQMEILYKGSQNRKFVFSFRFAPRSHDEMVELESIIRTLRYHAAPEYDKTNVGQSRYFIPPSEFDVEYFIGTGSENRHIPRIAQSVLTSIDVNYSPQGHYSTFNDGAPIEISMKLTFTETVVLTKDDIMLGY